MLQWETLPPSLAGLLFTFRWCFTAPSFRTFSALVAGMIAQPGRRTVVGMLLGAGLARAWHWSRAHWFFSQARWGADEVSLMLLRLIVDRLLDPGAPITVAVDDTLFRRAGRKVHAAGWHHDGRPTPRPGNGWVGATTGSSPGSWSTCRCGRGRCACRSPRCCGPRPPRANRPWRAVW